MLSSASVLVDAILVTTATMGTQERDCHGVPLFYWDRETDVATKVIERPSSLRFEDLTGQIER